MRTNILKSGFEQFLNDFAEAVELAIAGEIDEACGALAACRRDAQEAAGQDGEAAGAVLYRYELAQRVFNERYGGKR
jgi:hypothetical protein